MHLSPHGEDGEGGGDERTFRTKSPDNSRARRNTRKREKGKVKT